MIVFITGATAGFGAAMVRTFASAGHTVIATGRREERLAALAAECFSAPVHPFVLDVRDAVAVKTVVKEVLAAYGSVDVLINNAGLALGANPSFESNLEDWARVVDTNVMGLLNVTHAVLPNMVRRGAGHIINIGSTSAKYAAPGSNVYGASKAFVSHFSSNLRADLHGSNVRVSDIAPGLVGGTEFSEIRFSGDKERVNAIYENASPLTAEDIARSALWIAEQPPHVNVNQIELMPTSQSFAPLRVHRTID